MATQDGRSDYSAATPDRFAFVVPLVHPGGKKVSDYAVVERALKVTLRSYTRQDHGNVVVIVVCHLIPQWANEFKGRVLFLELAAHPLFEANVNDLIVDKGLKHVLGSAFAIARENASFVMLADGDDFVRTDLARLVFSGSLQSRDGYVIRQGYNVSISVSDKTFRILQVLRVQDFDRGCGTCRVFTRTSLTRVLEMLDPKILAWASQLVPTDGLTVSVDASVLTSLWDVAGPVAKDSNRTVQVLGRHVRQASAFDLQPLFEPLAAKACGHGNHYGPRRGGVIWSGVRGCVGRAAFLEQFGLKGGDIELGGFEPGLRLRGTGFGLVNRLRQQLNVRTRRARER
jgi:hypothetical protein